ncbi:hypothetical protein PMAYCL1PPCAC_13548, partial [Pristionchus mayeri]
LLSSHPIMTSSPASPQVFNIAGHEVKLEGKGLPEFIDIKHEVPEAFKKYAELRESVNEFDTVILIEDQRIQSHKTLLSGRVPYFRGLYESNMTECTTGEVPLNGNASSMIALIHYVYTGELKITEDNVEDLMISANYLGIESVMDECAQFDRKRLRVETALSVLVQCRAIGYTKIDDVVLRFIDKNFVPISQTPEFLKLDAYQLEGLLHRDTLHVDEEKQIFDAVTRWISESEDRLQHAVKLLRSIRCSLIPSSVLTGVIEKTKWVENNEECLALVQEAKDSHQGKDVSFSKHERRCDEAHALIFAVGQLTNSQAENESTMAFYDPIMDRWTKCKSLPSTRGRDGVAIVGTKIFAIGGYDGKDRLKSVDVYDAITDKWEKAADMSTERSAVGAGVIDGKIYAAGGYNGQASMNSMEMLNPDVAVPAWTMMAPMHHLRGAPAACAFNGKLYVIGGHDGQQVWKHGECYDPATNTWSMIAEMKYKRCRFGAAVCDGQIYVVGGFDGAAFLRDAERYDPSTNTWITIKQTKERRSRSAVAVSCGKLFVIGGFDGCVNLKSVEMYQSDTNTWVHRNKMRDHAGGIFLGTAPVPAVFPSPVANLEADDVEGSYNEMNIAPSNAKKAKNA